MRTTVIAGLIFTLLAPVVLAHPSSSPSAAPTCQLQTGTPLYRVFLGVRKAAIPEAEFVETAATKLIPTVRAQAPHGMVSYLVALPPAGKPAGTPDELALIVWESAEVYQAARQAIETQASSKLHAELFDYTLTRGGSAVPLQGPMKADVAYDLLQQPTDWQCGRVRITAGTRLPHIAARDFLARVQPYLERVKTQLSARGMDGLTVMAAEHLLVTFQHWPSLEVAEAALASAEGQALEAEAANIIQSYLDDVAGRFVDRVPPGQLMNIPFARRPPNR